MSDETLNSEAVAPAPDTEVTAASDVADNGQPGDAESQEPKTFTQEELDKIVGEAKAKAERKIRREMAQAAEAAQRPATLQPPDPNQFTDQAAYDEAVVDYRVDLKLAQREQQKQQTTVESTYAEREEAIRDKYTDFESVVYRDTDKGGPAISELMANAIKTSDLGPEVAYYLGKHVAESHRIHELSPIEQVREIGKIEARLSGNPPAKKVSSAPEPIRPIGGNRTSVPSYSTSDPRSTKLPSDEWIAKRNAEVAAKLRTQG